MPIKGQPPKEVVHTEMHKFKNKSLHSGSKRGPLVKSRKQAIAIALSEARKARKLGGSVEGDGKDDVSYGGQLPKSLQPVTTHIPDSWMRRPNYADGGDVTADDMIGRAREQLATQPSRNVLPDVGEPSIGNGGSFSQGYPLANRAADIGSKLGYGMMRGAVTNPYNIMHNMVEGSKESTADGFSGTSPRSIQGAGDLVASGIANAAGVRPTGGATSGVFVGPYGATALRNAAKETGNAAAERALVHPVVGKEIEKEVQSMPEWMRDPYRSSVQESRDEWARATLEARAAKGDFRDRDVFARSGWSFTADGKPAKEISDIGTSVKEHLVKPGGKGHDPEYVYSYEHPAGDLHKIYEIPPIKADPMAIAHGSKAYMSYGPPGSPISIGVGTNPTQATGSVGHEMQHAIAYREGWPAGSNPKIASEDIARREYFPGHATPEYQKKAITMAEPRLKDKINETRYAISTPETAKVAAYLHSAGENQAYNTQLRRRQSYRYLEHPEDTEMVPRGVQDIESFPDQFKNYSMNKRAGGGKINNFNPERASAFGLAKQGMIQSSVPGRTDKLNLNVPSGSYIIPADIPSAIGQGNTMAGSAILDKMFTKGPYGMNLSKGHSARVGARQSSLTKIKSFAKGGHVGKPTPIIAAGGEYIIHPDTVAALGNGDVDIGHSILDSFVKQVRAKHIHTLKKLKPPKGSK